MEKKRYIYLITNLLDKKQYIGQRTTSIKKDVYMGSGSILKKMYKEIGKNNFTKTIIHDNILTQKELDELEIYYIDYYNTLQPNGYNISVGGNFTTIGLKHSNETIKKMSKPRSEEGKKNIKKGNELKIGKEPWNKGLKTNKPSKSLGSKRTEEQKEKMRHPKSEEGKKAIQEAAIKRRGRPSKNKGIKHTEETKEKIKKSLEDKLRFGEDNPFYGKHHTEETKEKIRNTDRNTSKMKETKNNQKKQKQEEFLINLYDVYGQITDACKRTNICNATYHNWYKEEEFKKSVDEIILKRKEKIESKLFELIENGDRSSIQFWLKTKGGYSEKTEQEITIKDTNIVFELKLNDTNDNNKEFGITSGTE